MLTESLVQSLNLYKYQRNSKELVNAFNFQFYFDKPFWDDQWKQKIIENAKKSRKFISIEVQILYLEEFIYYILSKLAIIQTVYLLIFKILINLIWLFKVIIISYLRHKVMSYRIRANLNKKYDHEFNFHKVKPINEILYDQSLKASTLQFKDVTVLADLNQFLKRYYFLKNSAARNEIVQRLRMLTQFYQQNLMMRFEYPTMVVTNTKGIFLRRIRRLKKMEAGEDSSDISQQQQRSQSIQFSSSIFVKTIPSDVSKEQYCRRNKQNLTIFPQTHEQSYSLYDIYQSRCDQLASSINKLFDKAKQEEEVSHLICDFDDMDIQEALQAHKKAQKKMGFKYTEFDQDQTLSKQKSAKKMGPNASKIIITALDQIPPYKKSHLRNESDILIKNRQKAVGKYSPLNINSYNAQKIQQKQFVSPKKNRDTSNRYQKADRQQQRSYIDFLRDKQPKQEAGKVIAYRLNQKRKDQTYATRNQTYSRYFQNFGEQRQRYSGQPWKNQQTGFYASKKYQRPIVNSPSQGFDKYDQIKSFQFKKESPSRRSELRSIKTIKQKALALLSGAHSQQSLHFQNRY